MTADEAKLTQAQIELRNFASAYLMAPSRSRQDKVIELFAKKMEAIFKNDTPKS